MRVGCGSFVLLFDREHYRKKNIKELESSKGVSLCSNPGEVRAREGLEGRVVVWQEGTILLIS